MHLLSLERMQNFKTATPVHIQLNEAAREMRERKERERSENRHIVEVMFDVVRHLAKQNVAFRGHDKTSLSKLKGNFPEKIYFLAKYHRSLKDWIKKHPQNVFYLSHISQNEMLNICSNLMTNAICEQIHTSKYFSIESDVVTSHQKAFMSIILRYVTDFHIQERCLKLVPVSSWTGRFLADVILSVLRDHNLLLMDLMGKGFDGAANMSGKDEGAQQHLFEAGAQSSVHFHCFAHRLNLVLERSVENVTKVKTVFDAIGDIYRFMDGFPKRHALYKEHVKKQEITSGKTELHLLSDTKWTARSDNLDVIINVYPALLSMFRQMSNKGNGTTAGLLFRIKQFDFVSACLVQQKCFSLSRHASEYLQSEEMDLVTVVVAIQDLTSTYEAMRSQEEFSKLILNSLLFARENQSTLSTTETVTTAKRRRCLPSRFRDGQIIMMGSNILPRSHPEGDSVADRLRQNFFIHFLTDYWLN